MEQQTESAVFDQMRQPLEATAQEREARAAASRLGALVITAGLFVLPVVLAVWFALVGWAGVAFWWMVGVIKG